MQIRRIPGTQIKNLGTGEVLYTPPEGEKVILDHLSALEKFIHEEENLDPLVKLSLIHYQFEAIHPFSDGNGRTGRIINILYLVEKGLLDIPVLYLSRYIVRNKAKYYSLLSGVTERGEWEPWILYMLKAVEETSIWTTRKIREIKISFDKARTLCQGKLPKSVYSMELIENIFRQPYCRIDVLVKNGIAKRETASKYLQMLAKIGLLKPKKVGREKLYLNHDLIKILSN
jgi:Fic family protein